MTRTAPRRKGFDLNTLLHVANITALALAVYSFSVNGATDFADGTTILPACLLAFANVVALRYERRHKDPFVTILVAMTIVFYIVRIATLYYGVPWSWALAKFDAGPRQVDEATIFIALGNLAMLAGLAVAEKGRAGSGTYYGESKQRLPHPALILGLLVMSLLMSQFLSGLPFIGRLAGFAEATFLNTYFLLLISVVYVSMAGRTLHWIYAVSLVGLVAYFFMMTVIAGSRAALLEFVIFCLAATLSQAGRVRVGTRMLVLTLILAIVAPYFYFTATYLRNLPADEQRTITFSAITNFQGTVESSVPNKDILFSRMFERLGYLDAASAMMTGRPRYSKVIGVPYLLESIIDNALTPGFDVFDRAKIGLVLGNLDDGAADVPRRSELAPDMYASDMMTVYGEAYLFFGYGGLLLLFVQAYAAKRVYLWFRSRSAFELYSYRAIVLWCFYRWLSSYGMDWLTLEVITAGVFFAIFRQYLHWGSGTGPLVSLKGQSVGFPRRAMRVGFASATVPPVLAGEDRLGG